MVFRIKLNMRILANLIKFIIEPIKFSKIQIPTHDRSLASQIEVNIKVMNDSWHHYMFFCNDLTERFYFILYFSCSKFLSQLLNSYHMIVISRPQLCEGCIFHKFLMLVITYFLSMLLPEEYHAVILPSFFARAFSV